MAASIASTRTAPRGRRGAGAVVLAQPGLGDRAQRARELARRGLRRAPHEVAGQLAEARERAQPLDDVGLGGEELLAAQPEPLDQPVHEEVGARACRARRRPRGGA